MPYLFNLFSPYLSKFCFCVLLYLLIKFHGASKTSFIPHPSRRSQNAETGNSVCQVSPPNSSPSVTCSSAVLEITGLRICASLHFKFVRASMHLRFCTSMCSADSAKIQNTATSPASHSSATSIPFQSNWLPYCEHLTALHANQLTPS